MLGALALALASGATAPHAFADDQDTTVPTVALNVGGGYSIYKSAMVASNDTGTTVSYGVAAYGGHDHQIGMLLRREQSSLAFTLNKSTIAVGWQDFIVRYRLGSFYLGAVVNSSHWLVTRPPDADGDGKPDDGVDPGDFLDITTSGYGANTGFLMGLSKRASIYSDLTYATTGAIQEKTVLDAAGAPLLDRTIAVGARLDIDVGGSLQVLKWLDVQTGFKMRTYQVTVGTDTFKEQLNTTYVGLSASANL